MQFPGTAILCTGLGREAIREHFSRGYWTGRGLFSEETERLGAGGTVIQAAALAHGSGLLALNGGSFTAVDYAAFVRQCRARQAPVSMVLCPHDARQDAGNVLARAEGTLLARREKAPLEPGA